jgi:uncharacterized protein (DUF427 family)
MKALWNNTILAESDRTIVVEGNHYFPPGSIHPEFFRESDTKTRCAWKGLASYYDIVTDGSINEDAAWYYPSPTEAASKIKNHIAFWKGVQVIE